MNTDDRGLETRYIIKNRDGSPVDPSATYYVLKLSGTSQHARASRAALNVYAEKMAIVLPRLAADCKQMCFDEARAAGESEPIPQAQYVASRDGENFAGTNYPDRDMALIKGPVDLELQPGDTYWIGYLAPLVICGDAIMFITDLINSLDDDGHRVNELEKLIPENSEETGKRIEVLERFLDQAVRSWAQHYGVDLSHLWGVTGVEECRVPTRMA